MKKLFCLFALVIITISCKKEEKKYTVSYKIVETSANTPVFTVRYTLNNGASQSVGNISANSWTSGTLYDYKPGSNLTLEVEGSGGGKYDMYIFVNTSRDAYRVADDSNGSQKLETSISK